MFFAGHGGCRQRQQRAKYTPDSRHDTQHTRPTLAQTTEKSAQRKVRKPSTTKHRPPPKQARNTHSGSPGRPFLTCPLMESMNASGACLNTVKEYLTPSHDISTGNLFMPFSPISPVYSRRPGERKGRARNIRVKQKPRGQRSRYLHIYQGG